MRETIECHTPKRKGRESQRDCLSTRHLAALPPIDLGSLSRWTMVCQARLPKYFIHEGNAVTQERAADVQMPI